MAAEFHNLKIAEIIDETPDARSFVLEIPDALSETFGYEAGQFLTFEIPWEGMRIRRCYSLCSSPGIDPAPKVTVKRVDDGRVSNWFNDNLKVSDSINVQPPEGRFVLHQEAGSRPLVLCGGGSGVTPVMSILKTALKTTDRNVKLIYANRDVQSIIFKAELDEWQSLYPSRLEVVHHLDADSGFMSVNDVATLLEGWESAEFYVCGPGPYMDTVEKAFESCGIDSKSTKFERFVSPLDPDRRPAEEAPPPSDGAVPTEFTMTLEGKTHLVAYTKGKSLLDAAIEAGHKPPSSCEDGYCGCCMALCKTGKVYMAQHEALTDEDLEKDWVLPCQARAQAGEPIEIDFDAAY